MSIRQYRLTDSLIFAVILAVFELILHYALIGYSGAFTFSPLVPIVLLVIMRWGWQGVFYAVGDGILFCLLKGLGWQYYVSFGAGNAFIMVLLLAAKFLGKEKIAGKWYFSALFVVAGWFLVAFGRTVVAACCGMDFVGTLVVQLGESSSLLSLAMAIILILVMRRFDGMFEDQKHYLKRLDAERRERAERDSFGDEPIEIDEETLSILKRRNDLE
ncbi:MAG: hypothetical protein K2I20_00760 [Clostridia bacterium]|nr:hypothetical protein [Clostridia bacterium]MDE7215000.1 hypothetical protein [Clostridia bacterium]